MKRTVQCAMQRVLGFERYLFVFARATLAAMPRQRRYRDLFHFLDMIRPGDLVLDIGANIGLMTVLMSRRVPGGHVEAFEPIGENYRALNRIIDHYGLTNVTLRQTALGEQDGELQMIMPEESNVRMQGLSHVAADDDEAGQRYSVPVRRLDDLELPRGGSRRSRSTWRTTRSSCSGVARSCSSVTDRWSTPSSGTTTAPPSASSCSVSSATRSMLYDDSTSSLRDVPVGHQEAGNYFLVPPAA